MWMRQKSDVYIRHHQGAKLCMSSVSNMVYPKFSCVAAFYMLNGKNINVMLESVFTGA